MRQETRVQWIDALKGIAVLFVVVGHCLNGYLNADTFPGAKFWFLLLHEGIYLYHMPLFFLISGYTFSVAYIKGRALNQHKVMLQLGNMVLLYSVWAVLLWISKCLFSEFTNNTYGIQDLLNMFISPLGNYWYIYVLALIYVVVIVLKMWKWNSTGLLIGVTGLMLVARVYEEQLNLTLFRLAYFLCFFCVGCLLQRKANIIRSKKMLLLCLGVIALIGCCWWQIGFSALAWLVIKPVLVLAICGAFVVCAALIHWRERSFFSLCGTYCLHIYLIHPYFTAGNRVFLPVLGITQPYVALVVNTLSSLLVSLGIAMVCDRLPWTMILFRPVAFIQKYIVRK